MEPALVDYTLLCTGGELLQAHLGSFLLSAVLELNLVAVRFLFTVEDTQKRFQLRQRKRVPLQTVNQSINLLTQKSQKKTAERSIKSH